MTEGKRIGFIGCGNMAQALLNGFIKNELVKPSNVVISAPSKRNFNKIGHSGIKTTHSNDEVVSECDVIFLCCKPHIIKDALSAIKPFPVKSGVSRYPLFVSIIAGVTIATLEDMLAKLVEEPSVIRTMPNTPCMVSEGCSAYTGGKWASEEDGELVKSLLCSVGTCDEVPESHINIIGGIAGSGPAYMYMAIEALADGAVKMGLPRALAMKMSAQMVRGSATMVLRSEKHPGQLKDEVCSPGGTTIAAVHELERCGMRNAFISAVEASTLRAQKLG